MEAEVTALLSIQMDRGFAFQMLLFLGLTVLDGRNLHFAGNQVIARSGRQALSEFAAVIRLLFVRRVFLPDGMDGDPHTKHGEVIRAIGGAEKKAVILMLARAGCVGDGTIPEQSKP